MTELDSKTKYSLDYAKKNLKRIPLDVQKEKYTKIQNAAQNVGETVNGYIKKAIDERMERTSAAPDSVDAAKDTMNVVPEQKPGRHYEPFTQAAAESIRLDELLDDDGLYRSQIAYRFGLDVLNQLLEKARQQNKENFAKPS